MTVFKYCFHNTTRITRATFLTRHFIATLDGHTTALFTIFVDGVMTVVMAAVYGLATAAVTG